MQAPRDERLRVGRLLPPDPKQALVLQDRKYAGRRRIEETCQFDGAFGPIVEANAQASGLGDRDGPRPEVSELVITPKSRATTSVYPFFADR